MPSVFGPSPCKHAFRCLSGELYGAFLAQAFVYAMVVWRIGGVRGKVKGGTRKRGAQMSWVGTHLPLFSQ